MNRTVAFLDVLGFRQLVATTPPEELGPRFAQAIANVTQHMNKPALPGHALPRLLADHSGGQSFCISYAFSDSIILISHTDSHSSSLAVVVFALRAMQSLLAMNYAVRSAVTFGEMFVDPERAVFLGPALTAAYELEQRQDWVGGLLDDTLIEVLPELSDGSGDYVGDRVYPEATSR